MPNILNISEIFYSLQGEGAKTGTPAIFIRFAGCNLNCSFCDTNKDIKEKLSANEIMERISEYPAENVILTGGEPLMQNLEDLINKLYSMDYIISLETNGTFYPDWFDKLINKIDWITISPKLTKVPIHFSFLGLANEVKIVWDEEQANHNLKAIEDIYKTKLLFVQPLETKGYYNINDVIDLIKNKYPNWRLSVQLHKLLGIK
jgi:7-carboxy-7-deazaguanine synthase